MQFILTMAGMQLLITVIVYWFFTKFLVSYERDLADDFPLYTHPPIERGKRSMSSIFSVIGKFSDGTKKLNSSAKDKLMALLIAQLLPSLLKQAVVGIVAYLPVVKAEIHQFFLNFDMPFVEGESETKVEDFIENEISDFLDDLSGLLKSLVGLEDEPELPSEPQPPRVDEVGPQPG